MAETQGTHEGRPRPRGGYYSNTEPEQHPGRKIRKARQRLAQRQTAYDEMMKSAKSKSSGFRKPGSMKCR